MEKQLRKLALRATNSLKVASAASLMLFVAAASAQTSITVTNGDFELPGANEGSWANVDGWSTDTDTGGSGVETAGWWASGYPSYYAYTNSAEATIFNLTDHIIDASEEFSVTFDAVNVWQGQYFTITLFYDTGDGTRVPLGTQTYDLGTDHAGAGLWQSLELTAAAVPASAGAKLGVEFDNSGNLSGDNWNAIDNVAIVETTPLSSRDFELNKNTFKVFPNPSNGSSFKIVLNSIESSVNVKVYSVLGKVVLNKDFALSSKTIEVNQNLNSGIYIVKVNNKDSSKLIVK
ncbi:T9SS type A sorting domain-containing protein [Tamlana flava]|uniref:T9SS type A sorting domain-containing protein n=1 Tax=Tamlana flava TaxID=3158572 RepID=UPI00351B3C5B